MGFKSLPQVLVNGVPLDGSSLNENKFEQSVFDELQKITNSLKKSVQEVGYPDNLLPSV